MAVSKVSSKHKNNNCNSVDKWGPKKGGGVNIEDSKGQAGGRQREDANEPGLAQQ